LYNYFIVLFKIAFILIQPLAARTTINVCVNHGNVVSTERNGSWLLLNVLLHNTKSVLLMIQASSGSQIKMRDGETSASSVKMGFVAEEAGAVIAQSPVSSQPPTPAPSKASSAHKSTSSPHDSGSKMMTTPHKLPS